MSAIEAVSGPVGGATRVTAAQPTLLAAQQSASVVAELMFGGDVVAQAQQAIPPTPAALLDISPEAAGLINPVVVLTDNTQLLLLGEQTLELIGTSAAHPRPTSSHPTVQRPVAAPAATTPTTAAQPVSKLDAAV